MGGERKRGSRRGRQSTLGRLLGSEARAKVLSASLVGSPGRYYVRELAKKLVLPPTAVSRQLKLLERLGGVPEALRAALSEKRSAIRWAFLFGSMAGGEASAASDVDLFVVGEIRPMELSEHLRPVSELLGREINPFVIAPEEYREKKRTKNHFVARVLAGPKLQLIGDARSAEVAGCGTSKTQKIAR